ncbi:MAG: hypothetical protein D6768_14400 [Chloroflexi bacterium]|nr:MAG: hypothetical protein D6768_14400 [Chloroflexota bacterium]
MTWDEVRQQYPNQWLLVEAIAAHTEAERRILDQLAVINTFPDSNTALQEYASLHHQSPERELYVLHTEREQPEITERRWLGVRSA